MHFTHRSIYTPAENLLGGHIRQTVALGFTHMTHIATTMMTLFRKNTQRRRSPSIASSCAFFLLALLLFPSVEGQYDRDLNRHKRKSKNHKTKKPRVPKPVVLVGCDFALFTIPILVTQNLILFVYPSFLILNFKSTSVATGRSLHLVLLVVYCYLSAGQCLL